MNPKNRYADISTEEFDAELERQVDHMNASQILAIAGVYEILSEHLNNEVLDALRTE